MKKYYIFIMAILFAFSSSEIYSQCTPTVAFTGVTGDYINNFTFGSLTNLASGDNPLDYALYPATSSYVQGLGYSYNIQTGSPTWNQSVGVWIDYNGNNLFSDPGEFVYISPTLVTSATTLSGIITIPLTAVPGVHRMRACAKFAATLLATESCGIGTFGEYEDYNITIVSATPCTGMPIAGAAVALPANPCPGVTVNVSLTGSSLTGGLAYQWLRSTTGPLGPWVVLAGQTNPTLSILPPAGSVSYYKCIVTCTNSGLSDTSSATGAVVIQTWTPTSPCYCTPTFTSTIDDDIGQFTFGSLINPAITPVPQTPNPTSIATYTNFMSLTPVQNYTQGLSYPITVYQINTGFQFNCWAKVFIDYNHNANFTDPGEEVFSSASTAANGFVPTGSTIIPPTSLPGQTRLRVVLLEGGTATSTTPCINGTWGEVEDYIININPAGPYDPTVNSIVAPTGNLCPDSNQTLTAQICNYGSSVINMATNPITVTFTVNGPLGLTPYTTILSTGTLTAFGGCTTATMNNVNMFAGGNYLINANVSCPTLTNASVSNDSLSSPIPIINYRPTAGAPYQLCQFDNIAFGQGLTVSGCSAPIYDSVTITFNITGICVDNIGSTGGGTSFGLPANCSDQFACAFANGLIPALPPGSSFYTNGLLTVTNMNTAVPASFASEVRMNLYGATPTFPNLYSPGLIGNTALGSPNFTYSRTIPSGQLSDIFSALPSGGTLNMGYWESFNDSAPLADAGINAGSPSVATLKIYYQYVPPAFAWYDVATLGTSLYSLSPFDPLSYTNALVNNSNIADTFTFYAACAGLPSCRVPVDLIINPTPESFQDSMLACEYAPSANNAIFDLTTMNDSVSGNNLAASVEYFGDQSLASQIFNVTNDTSSTNFIYSKVFYATTGCYSSDSLYLEVSSIPQFIQPTFTGFACAPNSIDISSLISIFSLNAIDTFYYADPLYSVLYSGNPHVITSPDVIYVVVETNNGAACADSSIAVINVLPATNHIANQNIIGNYSTAGTVPCGIINLTEGNTETLYTTSDCRKVATVKDSVDGINLLDVTICEEIFSGVPVHNNQPYVNRSYEITPTNNGKALVCLYYLDQDFADYTAAAVVSLPTPWPPMDPTTNLCITQVDGGVLGSPSSTAISIPNSAITTSYDAATTVWTVCFPVDSFSSFYCHTCNPLNIPLPVSLLSFTGKRVGETSQLNWVTSSEQNNSHFILERSKDAKTFVAISSKINSKALNGNSNVNLEYDFTDASPLQGHNHYRLQQVDIDGHVSHSEVVDIYYGNETMITLYPNPVSTELNVDINTAKSTTAFIKITDATGRVVRMIETPLQAGSNSTKIDLQSLVDGVYMVSITNNKGLNYSQTIRKK